MSVGPRSDFAVTAPPRDRGRGAAACRQRSQHRSSPRPKRPGVITFRFCAKVSFWSGEAGDRFAWMRCFRALTKSYQNCFWFLLDPSLAFVDCCWVITPGLYGRGLDRRRLRRGLRAPLRKTRQPGLAPCFSRDLVNRSVADVASARAGMNFDRSRVQGSSGHPAPLR